MFELLLAIALHEPVRPDNGLTETKLALVRVRMAFPHLHISTDNEDDKVIIRADKWKIYKSEKDKL